MRKVAQVFAHNGFGALQPPGSITREFVVLVVAAVVRCNRLSPYVLDRAYEWSGS